MKRLYPLFRALSLIVFMFGLTMLLPVGLSWYLQDGAEMSFAVSMSITLGVALGIWLLTRHDKRELKIRDGFLIVVLVWTTLPTFATMPLMIQQQTAMLSALTEAEQRQLCELMDKLVIASPTWPHDLDNEGTAP